MVHLLNKTICTCCGEEIKWRQETKQRIYMNGVYVVEIPEPGVCLAKDINVTKNNITYRMNCNYCQQEIHVTVQK
ncbi:hypothetical protein SAMN02745751_01735 [Dethiosulfatibacter aminovorans DSM 17477]|uniref:Uncharacterized protein n=1 Tax=Dethiosulfatibacter aminovorans DSM 17477 TaxID=1121476 RepID=A0A1M6GFM3_9FIRM|nr:hypothetical protein [Dethiosulfatibacter aminovorans]SHJ08764.1 hypothetical protein SAMN02745751_01735 [Dethiosulfatibacter aminovorans DSM 17477]